MNKTINMKIEQAHQEWIAALDAIEYPIFIHDKEFRILRCNLAYQQYTGQPFQEIIGRPYYELFPKNIGPMRHCSEAMEHPTDKGSEEEVQVDEKIFFSRGVIIKDDQGDYLYSLHILKDITEQRRIEEALRSSEEKFRALVESTSDWIWEINAEGIYTYVSPRVEELLGYKPEELLGKSPFELMPSEERERIGDEVQKLIAECTPLIALQNINRCKDGTLKTLETSGVPFFDKKGVFSGYRGIDRDITERKQSEEALHRANRALKTLSAGNLALVRAQNEDALLQMITNIIVEEGGYSLAVVDYAKDDPQKSITPMAWSGSEEKLYWIMSLSWADTEQDQLPSSRVIRDGTTQICRNIAGDARFKPWRDAALSRGYVSNIALPLSEDGKTFGALSIYSSEANTFNEEEVRLLEELANDLAYGIITLRTRIAHEQQAIILQESLEQSIQTIASTVEIRDPYTAGHQRRVGELARAIGEEMGLPEEQIHGLHLAAIIHDLGKIQVPAEILSKPGKLSGPELMLIQTHPQAGYDILKTVKFPWPIADIILQHHEKLNGSGYPQGLKGDQILLEAKIITVADIVEAISSRRPYRSALGIEVALNEILHGRGIVYDPAVVDACLQLFTEKGFEFSSESI